MKKASNVPDTKPSRNNGTLSYAMPNSNSFSCFGIWRPPEFSWKNRMQSLPMREDFCFAGRSIFFPDVFLKNRSTKAIQHLLYRRSKVISSGRTGRPAKSFGRIANNVRIPDVCPQGKCGQARCGARHKNIPKLARIRTERKRRTGEPFRVECVDPRSRSSCGGPQQESVSYLQCARGSPRMATRDGRSLHALADPILPGHIEKPNDLWQSSPNYPDQNSSRNNAPWLYCLSAETLYPKIFKFPAFCFRWKAERNM